MPWAVAAAGVAAAGTAYSADQSKSAANTQSKAASSASETQQRMFNSTQSNLSPFLMAGQSSLAQLMQLAGLAPKPGSSTLYSEQTPLSKDKFDAQEYLNNYSDVASNPLYASNPYLHYQTEGRTTGKFRPAYQLGQESAPDPLKSPLLKPFGMEDFQASPAYQFNLSEGEKALNKASAARGQYYAPATLQNIAKYSQGLASNEFQNSYNNYNTNLGNIWNRLSTLAGSGQNAAANLGTNASQVAGQIGANQIGAGNAQAAGQVGQANAVNNGLGSAYNAYLTQQILGQNQQSSILPPQQSGGFDSSSMGMYA